MSFSFFVARRYRLSSTKFNTVRLISRFASFVIGVGVCAFFVIQSVFSGLHDFGLSYSSSLDPDLKIRAVDSASFTLADSVVAQIDKIEGVGRSAPVFSQEVVLRFKQQNKLISLKGVDESFDQLFAVSDKIPVGRMVSETGEEILLGYGTAIELGAGLYDYDGFVECLLPKQGVINPLDPNPFVSRWATNVGLFQISEEVDYGYAFAPIRFVRNLTAASDDAYTEINIRLVEGAKVNGVTERVQAMLGASFEVIEKEALNPALYRMLQTERVAIYLILSLVLIIALFNVVGAVVMMVLDKREQLQTLYRLGSSLREIRNIFFYQGMLLSGIGGAIGLLIGIVVVIAQSIGEFMLVPGTQLPYPVRFSFENLMGLVVIWGGLSVLAAWIASGVVRPRLLR
jgi:lipoprotein-releasing system permease protein